MTWPQNCSWFHEMIRVLQTLITLRSMITLRSQWRNYSKIRELREGGHECCEELKETTRAMSCPLLVTLVLRDIKIVKKIVYIFPAKMLTPKLSLKEIFYFIFEHLQGLMFFRNGNIWKWQLKGFRVDCLHLTSLSSVNSPPEKVLFLQEFKGRRINLSTKS